MRKKIVLIAALAAALTANSLAALNAYIVVKSPNGLVKGTVAGRETDKFAIQGFMHPKLRTQSLGLSKPQEHGIIAILIGLLAQPMHQAAASHTVLPTVTLYYFDKKGDKEQMMYKVVLQDVLISSYREIPNTTPKMEQYSISFDKSTETKFTQGALLDDWMKLPVGQGE